MATNDELLANKLFNVEGLVAVVTGTFHLIYSFVLTLPGGATGIGLSKF